MLLLLLLLLLFCSVTFLPFCSPTLNTSPLFVYYFFNLSCFVCFFHCLWSNSLQEVFGWLRSSLCEPSIPPSQKQLLAFGYCLNFKSTWSYFKDFFIFLLYHICLSFVLFSELSYFRYFLVPWLLDYYKLDYENKNLTVLKPF